MEIYEVLRGVIFKTEDVNSEERLRINQFFKENYGFEFKDTQSKAFEIQLQNAIYASSEPVNIIITMARTALTNKNNSNWHEVINYNVNG